MRRWLVIFLLVLLPLQLSWAAVAPYCQHEADATTQHFGHHQHKHQAATADELSAADAGDIASFAVDADCSACHAGCAAAMAAFPSLALDAAPALPGSPKGQRERPNWPASV
jgi:hypothetical protein